MTDLIETTPEFIASAVKNADLVASLQSDNERLRARLPELESKEADYDRLIQRFAELGLDNERLRRERGTYLQGVRDADAAIAQHRARAEAAESQLASKELEWVQKGYAQILETPFKAYIIEAVSDDLGKHWECRAGNRGIAWTRRGTEEEIKAAVQVEIEAALSCLSPSPDAAGGEESLEDRMKAAGMIPLADLLSGNTPMERWMAHTGVVDIPSFAEWLARKESEFMRMRLRYELGDEPKDELYEWIFAHAAAFGEVSANLRAAMRATPVSADKLVEAAGAGGSRSSVSTSDSEVFHAGQLDTAIASTPRGDQP